MPRLEVERSNGLLVKVGDADVKDLILPDWNLSYIELLPPATWLDYKMTLRYNHAKIEHMTHQRIYFSEP